MIGGDAAAAAPAGPERLAGLRAAVAQIEQRDDGRQRPDKDQSKARAIVLRQLAASPKTRAQLAAALAAKAIPDAAAQVVLDRMEEVGLIDDQSYARLYVDSVGERRGLAGRALADQLHRKGVPPEIVEATLATRDDATDEAAARALIRARLPRVSGLEREPAIRRLAGLLARKGYPQGLSLRVILEEIDTHPAFARD